MQVIEANVGISQDMSGSPIFGDGQVWIRTIAGGRADVSADVNIAVVQFNPGAQTAWHTHSGDQILYCVAGIGKVGDRDGEDSLPSGVRRSEFPAEELRVASFAEHAGKVFIEESDNLTIGQVGTIAGITTSNDISVTAGGAMAMVDGTEINAGSGKISLMAV